MYIKNNKKKTKHAPRKDLGYQLLGQYKYVIPLHLWRPHSRERMVMLSIEWISKWLIPSFISSNIMGNSKLENIHIISQGMKSQAGWRVSPGSLISVEYFHIIRHGFLIRAEGRAFAPCCPLRAQHGNSGIYAVGKMGVEETATAWTDELLMLSNQLSWPFTP